tara:strand:+ start:136 stop:489 length:354 start_codon:yes stop_codon:yes gene_type:complete
LKYFKGILSFNSVVACTPVNVITSVKLGEIAPTDDVVESPVTGTANSTVSEPTEDVADTPVGNTVNPMSIEPTEDVVDKPVGVTISVKLFITEPTEDVAETPVRVNEASIFGDSVPN